MVFSSLFDLTELVQGLKSLSTGGTTPVDLRK
jgi:hypothetical protein